MHVTIPPSALIGMVHVGALPGAPAARKSIRDLACAAAQEAKVLKDAGFDAAIIENMHDAPYINSHGPATAAAMTRIALAVRESVGDSFPLGVQVLSFGHNEALAVALAADAQFIRVENFVFAHVADEGLLPRAAAGELLRYRREIGADHIQLFCDIKKKHASHAITSDITLGNFARGAQFFGADGVIVTGAFTGSATDEQDVAEAKRSCSLPVWVGSGVTPEQVKPLLRTADALIVGTWIKHDGIWSNPVDAKRCRELVAAKRSQ